MDNAQKPKSDPNAPSPRPSSRAGELFFAFQRFTIKRLWTIIVLTLASQIGGFIAKRQFGEPYEPWGRQGIYILLLIVGLMIFWIVPTRAGFMRRLVWILLTAGAATLAITYAIALASQGTPRKAWDTLDSYWMTPLGWQWLFGGIGLAAIMWGGLWIRNRVARADRVEVQSPSTAPRTRPTGSPGTSPNSGKEHTPRTDA